MFSHVLNDVQLSVTEARTRHLVQCLSVGDFLQIKSELMKVASQNVITQSSDISRKLLRDKQKRRCLSTVLLCLSVCLLHVCCLK